MSFIKNNTNEQIGDNINGNPLNSNDNNVTNVCAFNTYFSNGSNVQKLLKMYSEEFQNINEKSRCVSTSTAQRSEYLLNNGDSNIDNMHKESLLHLSDMLHLENIENVENIENIQSEIEIKNNECDKITLEKKKKKEKETETDNCEMIPESLINSFVLNSIIESRKQSRNGINCNETDDYEYKNFTFTPEINGKNETNFLLKKYINAKTCNKDNTYSLSYEHISKKNEKCKDKNIFNIESKKLPGYNVSYNINECENTKKEEIKENRNISNNSELCNNITSYSTPCIEPQYNYVDHCNSINALNQNKTNNNGSLNYSIDISESNINDIISMNNLENHVKNDSLSTILKNYTMEKMNNHKYNEEMKAEKQCENFIMNSNCTIDDSLILNNYVTSIKNPFNGSIKTNSCILKNDRLYTDISEKKLIISLNKLFYNEFLEKKKKKNENINLQNNIETEKRCESTKTVCNKKNLKTYSLDDLKSGKIEIPETIFTPLPFNVNDNNIKDAYEKNKKLLNFMNDCNESTNLILKYPQKPNKMEQKTLRLPVNSQSAINLSIGVPIVYEDHFYRKNYHTNVNNLQMKNIFENHIFNILKNQIELGKDIFNRNKNEKCRYDNENGFWISNIDRKRLINPEQNENYITELVYEKEKSYEEEIKKLKSCNNFNEIIPPIQDFYKNNNFYAFLRKKNVVDPYMKPSIATIMRRYDVEQVSDYKTIQNNGGISAYYTINKNKCC